jgi:uncharacterized Fe-S center protein
MKKQISRRKFLKNTTAALGTAAIFGPLGMGYSKDEHKSNHLHSVDNQLDLPQVLFTQDISSNGLLNIYSRLTLNKELPGNVAVKLHSGEPGGHYFPDPDLIKDLVQSINGTIVECNTAYGGGRTETNAHKQVLIDHGFASIAPTDIMDEEGYISLPFPDGKNIKEDFVGSHFSNYDSFLILSHFKGHAMGGFGGAIKNMSIGIASSAGKCWIHTAGNSMSSIWGGEQDAFLESMAEAAGAVMNSLEDRIMYINLMNNLSVDCDCDSHPAPPELDDIGILASLDPVALDKACVDLIYASDPQQSASLRERMESRNGIHTLDHAEALGLGSQQYQLIELNPSEVVSENQDIPKKFTLNPAYPNPFNSSTIISYYLNSASFVELSIYNLKGQRVDCICKEKQNAGQYSYKWNPNSTGTGMYFIKLKADSYTDMKRCIYLK